MSIDLIWLARPDLPFEREGEPDLQAISFFEERSCDRRDFYSVCCKYFNKTVALKKTKRRYLRSY